MAASKDMHSILCKEDVVEDILKHVEDIQDEETELYLKSAVGLTDGGFVLSDEEEKQQAKRFMDWAKDRSMVKVTSAEVPIGIITRGDADLLDIKVDARGAPDDKIYDRNKDIRDKVARGNSFLHIKSGPYASLVCVIYALKKFTGGLGDDDDRDKGDNFTWKKYFTKSLDEAVDVVCTKKANGEAAHFSARYIGDKVVLCGGSKNVHMLFRSRDDILKHKDSRYQIARDVCLTIWRLLEEMTEDCRKRLLSFLCHSHFTAIFEILQPSHQHVEDLSYLKEPEVKFITWTTSVLEPQDQSQLSSLSPHVSIQIARALGLSTVQYDIIPIIQLDERMKTVREGYQYEGEVFYFLDASKSVIGLLKKKTIWYIIVRAIREKVRRACYSYAKSTNFIKSQYSAKICSRINEIQKWLGLDDESTEAWKKLATGFLDWSIKGMKNSSVRKDQIADLFPVVWNRYLSDTDRCDKISSKWTEPEGSDD
ncbi:uncharacterized protein LOC144437995 [Glandiceps talaboti]